MKSADKEQLFVVTCVCNQKPASTVSVCLQWIHRKPERKSCAPLATNRDGKRRANNFVCVCARALEPYLTGAGCSQNLDHRTIWTRASAAPAEGKEEDEASFRAVAGRVSIHPSIYLHLLGLLFLRHCYLSALAPRCSSISLAACSRIGKPPLTSCWPISGRRR